MNSGIVVRNDDFWQGHPDVARLHDKIFVVWRESDRHKTRGGTAIKMVSGIWKDGSLCEISDPIEIASSKHRFNCPRLSVINNTLWLICDEVLGGRNFLKVENDERNTRIHLWKMIGENWEGPIQTNITGIVPDRICEWSGKYLISTHTQNNKASQANDDKSVQPHGNLFSSVWSTDELESQNWHRISLASSPKYNFCEASVIQSEGVLLALLRENSGKGWPAFSSISKDGKSWSTPYRTRLFGCHRPVTGMLRSGRLLTTYREASHSYAPRYWGRNTFAHLADIPPSSQWENMDLRHGIILPIDHDNSPRPDSGYTGWIQMSDDSIFIVNYITKDAPKPYIAWHSLTEEEFDGVNI